MKKKVRPPPAPLPKAGIHRVPFAPLCRKVQSPGLDPFLRAIESLSNQSEFVPQIFLSTGTRYRKEMLQDRGLAGCSAGELVEVREKIAHIPGE